MGLEGGCKSTPNNYVTLIWVQSILISQLKYLKHSKTNTGKRSGNVLSWETRMQIAVEAAQGEKKILDFVYFIVV